MSEPTLCDLVDRINILSKLLDRQLKALTLRECMDIGEEFETTVKTFELEDKLNESH